MRPASPRRSHWPRATLRTYLFAIILTATAPLAVLMSYQIVVAMREHREALLAHLQGVAKAVAVGVDRELQASIDTLALLAQSEALQRGDLAVFESQLRAHVPRASWERIALLTSDASVALDLAATPPAAAGVSIHAAEVTALIERWNAQPALGAFVWNDAANSTPAGSSWIAKPVETASGTRYLLAARVASTTWRTLLQGVAPDDGGFVTLIDDRGRRVAQAAAAQRVVDPTGAGPPPPASAGIAGDGSPATPSVVAGDAPETVWHPLQHGGWKVGVGALPAESEARQRRAMLIAFAAAAGWLLLGVSAALVIAQRVARPLRRLARRDAPEDPDDALEEPIEVTEIAQLRDAFGESERERTAAATRLAKKAEEFETLFRSCPTGLALAQDPACTQVLRNAAMDDTLPCIAHGGGVEIHAAGRALRSDELPLARAARDGTSVAATELEVRRPGQAPRFVLASAVPLADASGGPRGAIGSVIDVSERKRAEQERAAMMQRERAARHEAEAANRAKDDLLAMLGHELRNPLNAIVTAAEVLRRAEPGDALAASARAVVGRQTRKLAALVDQLLDVGQVMADEVRLRSEPVELAELVQHGVAAAQPGAAEREQRLVVGALAPVWVRGDGARIEQVLSHLLDNAMKHTPAQGAVEVELLRHGCDAVLRVRDSGPGIDAPLLARMFEPFVQGNHGLHRPAGGLGIGLTLVKRLVELQGGSVRASTSAHGSMFEVCLPAIDAPQRPAHHAPGRVGVIDDNPDALAGMRAMLELAGHAVQTAADGSAGLAMLTGDAPDVAIVDIGLPGIDGYEVARRSRAAGYRGRLIALSGYGQQRDLQRSMSEGFDAHLVKPVDPDQLLPLLNRAGSASAESAAGPEALRAAAPERGMPLAS